MKEPHEVLMDIQLDWKRKGISIESVRQKLNYKTRQSIYNILSSNKYLKPSLAKKFSEQFGYNESYLTCGAGNLFDNSLGCATAGCILPDDVKDDLIFAAEVLLSCINDPVVNGAWHALNSGDESSYIYNVNTLMVNLNKPSLRVLLQDRFTKYVLMHTKYSSSTSS